MCVFWCFFGVFVVVLMLLDIRLSFRPLVWAMGHSLMGFVVEWAIGGCMLRSRPKVELEGLDFLFCCCCLLFLVVVWTITTTKHQKKTLLKKPKNTENYQKCPICTTVQYYSVKCRGAVWGQKWSLGGHRKAHPGVSIRRKPPPLSSKKPKDSS